MSFPYKEVFAAAESSLKAMMPPEKVAARLDPFLKYEFSGRRLTDEECYRLLVHIVFYSGFRAATVTRKLGVIDRHFGDWQMVAAYGVTEVEAILADLDMIRNRRKVEACVQNAKVIGELVRQHGSVRAYLDSFCPDQSLENLLLLKEELESRFQYLGGVTVYHFLTDIGLPVLKPDRVICRIFHRLGLLDSEGQLLKAVLQGRKFAQATDRPMRYIDIVFVAYGQVESPDLGITKGICLDQPRCEACGLTRFCQYQSAKAVSMVEPGKAG